MIDITALYICKENSKKIKVVYRYLARSSLFDCNFSFFFSTRIIIATSTITSHCISMASIADCTGNSPDSEEFSVSIVTCLLVYITGHGSKKKTAKKETKIKEFSHTFSTTRSNYLKFLTTVLIKHYIRNKLQVTDCRCYTCKMQVPPST